MRPRRSLGRHLTWLVTLSVALGLLTFSAVAAAVVWIEEAHEVEEPDDPDEPPDSALDEVIDDVGPAIGIATPIGLLVAVLAARRASRTVTTRLDRLIATASRMTGEHLDERLPLSSRGDELDDLAAALNELFARIDDGIAALRRFAADASHELRTPLAVMISTLEVTRRRPRDAAAWEQTGDRMLEELREMADLVEGLLQGARAGAFDLAGAPIDVDAEAETIANRWADRAAAAGVTVAVAAGSRSAARIDPRGLAIAAGNLIGNAIAHSPRGGTITVQTLRRGPQVRIEVSDQGPGVAADERARIFEPFARGDGARPEGAGLGLAIARRIVEANRGRITVDDAPRGGARFAIELPAEERGPV